MKTVKPSYEILECPEDVLVNIERAARTCYKSEDKITHGSAEKLVRNLIKRGHMAMIEFGGFITVKFTSDRGFSHELVRHRMSSFAQESTRYVNYSKGKFGSEITCIDTENILKMKKVAPDVIAKAIVRQIEGWTYCQQVYMDLVEMGVPPEIARNNLPIGLKAEIVISANVREWRHISSQRADIAAHPRMRELMYPLFDELRERCPVIFDDVGRQHAD